MLRASARENTKSASLSAQQSQQPQSQLAKLQEKLKCVNLFVCFHFSFFPSVLYGSVSLESFLCYFFKILSEFSDQKNHHQLGHHHQIAIQVRFEFIRVHTTHLLSSKNETHQEKKNRFNQTIHRHNLEILRIFDNFLSFFFYTLTHRD